MLSGFHSLIRNSMPQKITSNTNESISSQNTTSDEFIKWCCLLLLFAFYFYFFNKPITAVIETLTGSLTSTLT